ncbi:DEAD/DEAH box helicase [Glutamicibacter sp. JL.03c]|uniref:DEAD/DEAH box helicase n=1 Tax=Glutamicibacter sp. JL.03c TaxID=2984842 RepID=UPI0021F7946D|nr:DEAD/DEAH box helicase [Glutamicibacter sp. JL.03c]UYQ79025.1 DEAD/DEAH box helicase [Glutamicibacter sp. JL.03c]
MTSPAEQYANSKARQVELGTALPDFRASISFDLDPFQAEACKKVTEGHSVLVAAPTGAGKTVVGEFAIFQALRENRKAFYTTPIKALSNQKYSELVSRYGAKSVGLLTGDTSINSEAQIVVMTTEVLRNMLYADSQTLDGLGYVIMDEVHYLADKFRGAVWEEVIIHLPSNVQIISLSATVSNAEEFGGWLDTVRGQTDIIVSEHRPVPLFQHVMVGPYIVDLFAEDVAFDKVADDESTASVNPELRKLVRTHNSSGRVQRGRGKGSRGPQRGSGFSQRVNRPSVIGKLDRAGLLPAIFFIFSRKGCDMAVQQCAMADLRLTTNEEAAEIAQALDEVSYRIPSEDLDVLEFWAWRDGLIRGFASHHAGLLPIFKEIVEDLFARNLIKVVFATETLALGVNMPARSVVLEKLVKFNGESHVQISSGEYTQLTGRAGRRGIDVEGHSIVVWNPELEPEALAGLASKRTYPLNSSFRPTYNMSTNLLAQFGREQTRQILESSFAQYQADRSVVGMARQVRSKEESLAGYAKSMQCHLGDFTEYLKLQRNLSALEKNAAKSRRTERRSAAERSLQAVIRGDVVDLPGGRRFGRAVIVELDTAMYNPRHTVLTEDGQVRRLSVDDLNGPVEIVSRIRIPKGFTGRAPKERRDLASSLRNAIYDQRPPRQDAQSFNYEGADSFEREIAQMRLDLKDHPCHACSEKDQHMRWADRYWKLKKDTDKARRAIRGRTNTIATQFDKVCKVLEQFEYLVPAEGNDDFTLTDSGRRLRKIYGERDLLTSQILETGKLSKLNAEELCAVVASLVYQARRDGDRADPKMPTDKIADIWNTTIKIWGALSDAEETLNLDPTAPPESGLIWPMYKWARGSSLNSALRGTDMAPGDFVRWAKQVIDTLDQFAKNSELPPMLVRNAYKAVDQVKRGVVAYSNVLA